MSSALPSGLPSPWMIRHTPLIASGGNVLDLACGNGRHAIWLAQQGYLVEAVDRDKTVMTCMENMPGIHLTLADLESGTWPYAGRRFGGIVVSRYLHRPLLPLLAEALNPHGVLIYETFMLGQERYGKPSNPDFLLRPDELLTAYSQTLTVMAFEQGEETLPAPVVMQRICAIYNP